MVALQSPLVGMQMDEQAAAYVGILERRVAALNLNELKFQALMEISTGQKWETMVLDFENNNLDDIARQVVQKQTGVSDVDARRIVREYRAAMATKQNTVAEQMAVDNNKNAIG